MIPLRSITSRTNTAPASLVRRSTRASITTPALKLGWKVDGVSPMGCSALAHIAAQMPESATQLAQEPAQSAVSTNIVGSTLVRDRFSCTSCVVGRRFGRNINIFSSRQRWSSRTCLQTADISGLSSYLSWVRRGDLTDQQWRRLKPLLPPKKPWTGRPNEDHRRILNGILWIDRTGAPWRDLPRHYGPVGTVSSRFYRWRKAGIWQRILLDLQAEADCRGEIDWNIHFVDATIVRAH